MTHSPAACVPLFVLTTLLSHSITELTYGNMESICEIDRLTNCKKSTYPALDFHNKKELVKEVNNKSQLIDSQFV